MKLSSSDVADIQRLSSSPSFLKLADSILTDLDRDTLAEFIAAYLYFKSKGRANTDFAFFIVAKKFSKVVSLAMNVLGAMIQGLLLDKEFRSVIFDAAMKSFKQRQAAKPGLSQK